MFIAVSTLGEVKCGEPMVMKADRRFGQVGVYEIGGPLVGYVRNSQPQGCVDSRTIYSRIGDNRIVCSGAVAFDNTLIVTTDSALLKNTAYVREEAGGYYMVRPTGSEGR